MSKDSPTDAAERLEAAYNRMMERVSDFLKKTEPPVQHAIDSARDTAVELGELTRDEAHKIAEYLRRDLHDAGEHLADTGKELSDWFSFDLELVENRLLEMFTSVADRTSVELMALAERAREASRYQAGEITGPGTLYCVACGAAVHFEATNCILPCIECQGTEFQRSPPA